jgi:tetratricopeptide (TPR) repeat protein
MIKQERSTPLILLTVLVSWITPDAWAQETKAPSVPDYTAFRQEAVEMPMSGTSQDFDLYQLGRRFESAQNLPAAQTCYEAALKLSRVNSVYVNQSEYYYERAAARVRTIRARELVRDAYNYETGKDGKSRDLDMAIDRYKEALSLLDYPSIWWQLATAYQIRGDLKAALLAYEKATGKAEIPKLSKPIQLLDGAIVTTSGKVTYPRALAAME